MKLSKLAAMAKKFDIRKDNLKDTITIAAQLISQGHIIGVPTDTIYGLACDVQNNSAISRLYAVKERSLKNPVSICVGNVNSIACWSETNHIPHEILNALLPGPVTVVLKRSSHLNPLFNSSTTKVGIRIPECEFIKELANACASPLALTSANLSGEDAALDLEEFRHLWPHLEAVFDGGRIGESTTQRQGSTVVDLTIPNSYEILRRGVFYTQTCELLERFGWVKLSKQDSLSDATIIPDCSVAVNCS